MRNIRQLLEEPIQKLSKDEIQYLDKNWELDNIKSILSPSAWTLTKTTSVSISPWTTWTYNLSWVWFKPKFMRVQTMMASPSPWIWSDISTDWLTTAWISSYRNVSSNVILEANTSSVISKLVDWASTLFQADFVSFWNDWATISIWANPSWATVIYHCFW